MGKASRTEPDRAQPSEGRDQVRAKRRRKRSGLWIVLGLVLVAVAGFSLVGAARAGRSALRAKAALLRAEQSLSSRDLEQARGDLTEARQQLVKMKGQLEGLGPIVPVAKVIPIVRSQVVAVETFQSAGTLLADAGLQLADAAEQNLKSSREGTPVARALNSLRAISATLAVGAESVRVAESQVATLKGKWLVGPIADARDDLLERLPRYARQVVSTDEGLTALIAFAGGDGPRRYLLFTQNPDEIRPTGGFFGTYATMTATADSLQLDRFAPIVTFYTKHPGHNVPGGETKSPFRFARPPIPQSIGNTNSIADFSVAGKLAADLWNTSGEPPVDGVVSFTPAFLGRLLAVLGPVEVAEYGEVVDHTNLIPRIDFYTAQLEADLTLDAVRKGFLASLGEVVLEKLLEAPSDRWQALGEAVGKGFSAREAMAWSSDPKVAKPLADRRWDGTLPKTEADFFYNGEFSYAAKFNRGIQRTFDHHVEVRTDGSARITTTMAITNTRDPAATLNPGLLNFVTFYGPQGATLHATADPPATTEASLADHPAVGYFVSAPAYGTAKVKVVWEVKDLVTRAPNGTRQYSLWWLRVPDHGGDVLNLRIDLPKGWGWRREAPPSHVELNEDMRGTWTIATG